MRESSRTNRVSVERGRSVRAMKAIRDEFTDRPISRQRKYQLRHQRDGLCVLCEMKATHGTRCFSHSNVRTLESKTK